MDRTSSGKGAQEAYKEAEEILKKMSSLQKEIGKTDVGTDHWNELFVQFEKAKTRLAELQAQMKEFESVYRDLGRENGIGRKLADIQDAMAANEAKINTEDTKKKVNKVYEETEEALNSIISLQKQLDSMSDKQGTPYWEEVNQQLKDAQANYYKLVNSWKDFSYAYRNLDKEDAIKNKMTNFENSQEILAKKRETEESIADANELYKEQARLIQKIYDLRREIWQNQRDGEDFSIINDELQEAESRLTMISEMIGNLPEFARNQSAADANNSLQKTLAEE